MGKLSKVKEALDMALDARKARAREMGFDTDKVWYHGTNRDIDAFDLGRHGENEATGDYVGKGVYFSQDPDTAQKYAERAVREGGGSPSIYPVHARMDNPLRINDYADRKGYLADVVVPDDIRADYGKYLGEDDLKNMAFSRLSEDDKALYAKTKGYDGFIDGTYPQGAVLDPSQIRSVNAAFDPAKKDSANLMAGVGGAAILGTTLAPEDAMAMSNFAERRAARNGTSIRQYLRQQMTNPQGYDSQQFLNQPFQQAIPVNGSPRLIEAADTLREYTESPLGGSWAEGAADLLEKHGQGQSRSYLDYVGAAADFL